MCLERKYSPGSLCLHWHFFSVPSSKDSRIGRFRGFSSLYVEVYFKPFKIQRPMTLFLIVILALHFKSFLTAKECAHCRSPGQKNIYIHLDS